MYKKILVPLDGSPRAERILPHVENLSMAYQSTVIFLQVVRFHVISNGYQTISVEQSIFENRRSSEEALIYLSQIEKKFREKGIRTKKIVDNGSVVPTIIRVSQEENVGLIAMASHGRGGLSRVFYGSVASGVLNAADRALLLIRSRENETD